MKQRIIRVMGLTITSMFAIALMSCSNDLFIEFNNEDSLYEYDIKSQSLKGHQTFLL